MENNGANSLIKAKPSHLLSQMGFAAMNISDIRSSRIRSVGWSGEHEDANRNVKASLRAALTSANVAFTSGFSAASCFCVIGSNLGLERRDVVQQSNSNV